MRFLRTHKLLCTEIVLTVVLIVFISLCVKGRVRDDVPLANLKAPLLACLAGAENMKEAGALKLRAFYGLTESDYTEVLLYIPVSNMDAQEMLLVRCASEEQTETVANAMRKRIKDQTGIFESYGIDQMALISKALVDVQGTYCLYVCDGSSYEAQAEFRRLIAK